LTAWPRLRFALRAALHGAAWRLPPRVSRALLGALRLARPVRAESGTVLYINCPPVESPAFARHLAGLGRLARGEHVPLAVHVSVTDRCECRCARCSNLGGGREDPPLEALARLFAELRAAGTSCVALTGGEPALRPDLDRLVAACGPELAPLLFTSGLGIDTARAGSLRAAGLTVAVISLDHFEAAEHDRLRGRPGTFAAALQAIAACRSAGLYTAAQAVAGAELLAGDCLERFVAFCAGLGVHDVVLLEPFLLRPGAGERRLSAAQRERLCRLHLESARHARRPKVTAMPFIESARFLGCQAGCSFVYVDAGGGVWPCDFAPLSFGNAYRGELAAALRRMAECRPRPGALCPALAALDRLAPGEKFPLAWPRSGEILGAIEPGPLPALAGGLARPSGSVRPPESP
jgi:MoaA/NifB/PqqE/SkfB family radical SAM enzyme